MSEVSRLLKITATKRSIILSLCFGLLGILVFSYFFIISIKKYMNPAGHFSYVYPYGYGLYARNLSIILGILIIIYIIVLFFLVRKHQLNVIITLALLLPIFTFSMIGFLVISIKENRSAASYTTNVADYEMYDEFVAVDMALISDYLPKKSMVNRYEYLLYQHSSLWGRHNRFTIFIETDYDQNIFSNITANNRIMIKEKLNDSILSGFEYYEYVIDQSSTSNDSMIDYLYIFINKSENRIIYVITNRSTDILSKYDNNFYIGAFINGDRNNPYFTYKSS